MGFQRADLVLGVLLIFCEVSSLSARAHLSDACDPVVIQVRGPDIESNCREFRAENPLETTLIENEAMSPSHNISIVGNEFILDGHPLHIISGSLHYFRVPALYWRDRLRKLKAAGLNSVSTYVEWSYHEPEERQYDFEGDRDVAAFVKTAAEEGLHVLLRPGPYICAERDLGGFPYWLLGKYPNIRLRTTDKDFIEETKIWMTKLFEHMRPLLFGNGGPIILVQVENEYGSYGNDMPYKVAMRDILLGHVGTNALLYTTDGASSGYFVGGAVPGALTTIDFGPTSDSAQSMFRQLRRFMDSGPLMNSEYYTGWLTHWRERIAETSIDAVVRTLKDMLDNKISVNFYMFFGGSNFEFTAGANYDGTYQPDITSYDYDAPLSEAGDPTPKYYAIREALKSYNLIDPRYEEAPLPSSKGNYGTVTVVPKVNLLSTDGRGALGKKYDDITGSKLPTFESVRQRSGLLMYETTVPATSGLLEIQKPRDLVFVFVDGCLAECDTVDELNDGLVETVRAVGSELCETKCRRKAQKLSNETLELMAERSEMRLQSSVYVTKPGFKKVPVGKISRMQKIYSLPLTTARNESVLSLLVENQGRINFGSLIHDYKGILSEVKYANKVLNGDWKVTGYPLEKFEIDISQEQLSETNVPTMFEGQFKLPEGQTPLDTFLDTSGWGKGYIWINGHNLGRYWPPVGPQVTLYVPAVWLKPAPEVNLLQILELDKPSTGLSVQFIDHPILNRTGNINLWK